MVISSLCAGTNTASLQPPGEGLTGVRFDHFGSTAPRVKRHNSAVPGSETKEAAIPALDHSSISHCMAKFMLNVRPSICLNRNSTHLSEASKGLPEGFARSLDINTMLLSAAYLRLRVCSFRL